MRRYFVAVLAATAVSTVFFVPIFGMRFPTELELSHINERLMGRFGFALFKAIDDKDPTAVAELVAQGADVNVKNINGYTPLHQALWFRHNCIEVLLQNGADANLSTNGGYPIEIALERASLANIKLLLQHGARLTERSLLSLAKRQGLNETQEILDVVQKNLTPDMLAQASTYQSKNKLQETALYYALKNYHTHLIKYLIKQGASINQKTISCAIDIFLRWQEDAHIYAGFFLQAEAAKKNLILLYKALLERNGQECCICNESFTQEPSVLACCHLFCQPCIAKWQKQNATCPICRQTIVYCPKVA